MAAARSEFRLDVLLRGLRFDPFTKDPREKVGLLFQHVDKKLNQYGVVGVFAEKDIAKFIVRAVEPRDLRERVEFELSTEAGKQYGRSLRLLYALLVEKYTLWYQLHPDGGTARFPRRGEADGNMALRRPAQHGQCYNCGRTGHRARDCGFAGQNKAAGERPTQRFQDNGRRHSGAQGNLGTTMLQM